VAVFLYILWNRNRKYSLIQKRLSISTVGVLATCVQKPNWIVLSCYSEFYGGRPVGYCETWSLLFRNNNLSNGASYVLDRYALVGNRVRNPSNSAPSIASDGSNVAPSQHLRSFLFVLFFLLLFFSFCGTVTYTKLDSVGFQAHVKWLYHIVVYLYPTTFNWPSASFCHYCESFRCSFSFSYAVVRISRL